MNGPLKVCGLKFKVRPISLAGHFPPVWVSHGKATWSRWKMAWTKGCGLASKDNKTRERTRNKGARSDHSNCWWNLRGVKREWGIRRVKCSETVAAPVNSGSGCPQSHESCGVPDGASGKDERRQAESGMFDTEITELFFLLWVIAKFRLQGCPQWRK